MNGICYLYPSDVISVFYWGLFILGSSAKESFSFLTKYLATFSNEDAYTISEAKEEAVRAIIEFVKAPDMFQVPHLCDCWIVFSFSLMITEMVGLAKNA